MNTKYPGIRMCLEVVQVSAYLGPLVCFSVWTTRLEVLLNTVSSLVLVSDLGRVYFSKP